MNDLLRVALGHFQGRRFAEAEAGFRELVRLNPGFAEGYQFLGLAIKAQGRVEEAVGCFRESVRLNGDSPEGLVNLGNALQQMGGGPELAEAEGCYRRALKLRPGMVEGWLNLGQVLTRREEYDEAIACGREVVRPELAEGWGNLGTPLAKVGRVEEAVGVLRKAVEIKPELEVFQSSLLTTLNYVPGVDRRGLYEAAQAWGRGRADDLMEGVAPHANDRNPGRRLRVGYVSADLREHSCRFFIMPLLKGHDRERVEVFCYAQVERPDGETERMRGLAGRGGGGGGWRFTQGLSDGAMADLIRADGIDVVMDLKVHSPGNRLLALARKPAPVQVTWLGYPGTTGMRAMDYRLTDRYLDPVGETGVDEFYAEESVRLAETYWCFDPLEDVVGRVGVSELPALKNGYVTFGCLNDFCKVNEGVVRMWAGVLRAVRGSRMVILAPRGECRRRVVEVMEREGVEGAAGGRIEFLDRRGRAEYLGYYQRIDVGLDTVPYNGHTTSLDAFWMGVPVCTLVGGTAVGRVGLSQAMNLALPELVAHGEGELVGVVEQLVGDLAGLARLRAGLRERMRGSALMDAGRFARAVEEAYRGMWERWCGGKYETQNPKPKT